MVKKSSLSTIVVFHTLLILVTAFLLCLPISAYAGADAPPPEPTADVPQPPEEPEGMPIFGTPVYILPTSFYAVAFLHNPNISENAFTLRVSQYGTVAGCAHLQYGKAPRGQRNPIKGKTTVKYVGNGMNVMLDIPITANSDGEPRYTNHDCKTSHLESYIELELDRDELIERNIAKFSFKTQDSDLGEYDIDLSKNRIILKSKNVKGGTESWLTLWFFPKGTIKLYVPEARSDMNVIQKIRDFGVTQGLVPVENILEGYTLSHAVHNYAYFTDPKQIFLKDLSVQENNKKVGDISTSKTYYGPKGPQDEVKSLPVYASIVLERKLLE